MGGLISLLKNDVASAVGTEVEWIEDEASFRGLAAEWDALAATQEPAWPFDLHCWYAAVWESFFAAERLAICTVRRDGRLAGVFPLLRRGRRLVALANVHSCVYRPLAADPEAAGVLLEAVMGRRSAGLQLVGVPVADGWFERLEAGAGAASRIALVEGSYSSPYIDTSGEFAVWREANKKRWKAPLEKKRRKMDRDHEAEFAIVVAPTQLEAELEEGLRIEASGWKGENGTAILSAADTAAFYRAVARCFAERDELRFSRIALDGETIAFDFALLHDGRLHSLKVGYDERFRSLAPALVMRLSMIERCFELGLRTHELLGDDAPWKSQFSSGSRDHAGFFAYSRGLGGGSLYAYRAKLRPRLQRGYRRLRPHAPQRRAASR
jgi:CelD/BcsL family acetyltransferase involved in cellulose biosynthesis